MGTITRPAAGYTPANAITNSTKYQDDRNNGIKVSSVKVDGDINKSFDILTDHDNLLEDHEGRLEELEGVTPGTVTSVALVMPSEYSVSNSPVTDEGTLTVIKVPQTAKTFYAGPTAGSPDEPEFRPLVATDIASGTANALTYLAGDMTFKSTTFLGSARASTGNLITCTGSIPSDDTIPQQTEGTELLTVTYTPKSAVSILKVSANFFGTTGANGSPHNTALFRDSQANAFAASTASGGVSFTVRSSIVGYVLSGDTIPTTFKVRHGLEVAGNLFVNGTNVGGGVRLFGGMAACTLTVEEFG